jgi:phage terminase large subunit-like protein
MMEWSTECKDWEERIIGKKSLITFPPLFTGEAYDGLEVFKQLRVVDVMGKPTFGEITRDWIYDFVGQIFGSYDVDTGRRLISEYFMLISKKNSKSTSAAGIMLTALIRNWRESAEYLILAPTVEIANNSFYPARDMVRADEELSAIFQVQDHIRTITHRVSGANLKVIAAEAETVGGKKATGILVDELHLFGKKPNAENMLREATGGIASRPEGFVIYLTTQSDEPPAGVFRQKLQYARDVRDGIVKDKHFLPVLYEFPEKYIQKNLHREKENFYITNPNLGASVDETFLLREFDKAENAGEESLRNFLAKHLNVEIGLALRADRWAGADYWETQGRDNITLDYLLENCDVVDIGIDGGGLDDLLGLAVVGRLTDSRQWVCWTHAWAHPSVLERRKSEAARFKDFDKQGNLTLVKRIGDDVDEVVEICVKVDDTGLLDKIGVDPHGLGGILDALLDNGIEEDKIIGVSQGWKLQGAIKTAERKLAEGELIHSGQPMMAWCVGNAKVEPKGNAVLITKQASGFAKIDPLMALFNAVNLISLNPEPLGGSVNSFIENPVRG